MSDDGDLKMSWEKVSGGRLIRDRRLMKHVCWGAASAGIVGCGLGAYFQWYADVGPIRNAIIAGEFSLLGGGALGAITGRIHNAFIKD